jgi:16S rRNA (guanine527-N7)-methyltransferase
MSELWRELAARAGVELTDVQIQRLERYLDLLIDANQHMNLTRITDRQQATVQHVGDALTLLPHLPAGGHRLADVGTGGGVPGIPLAIARPDLHVTLIDSTKKKAAFLRECAGQLQLQNVQVIEDRAETVGRSEHREAFDIACARAVATLDWLCEWCLPLVKKGGKVLAAKGARHVAELPAARKVARLLGGGQPVAHPVELPGTTDHVIVEIPKISKTDKRLPRDPTQAKGRPLG